MCARTVCDSSCDTMLLAFSTRRALQSSSASSPGVAASAAPAAVPAALALASLFAAESSSFDREKSFDAALAMKSASAMLKRIAHTLQFFSVYLGARCTVRAFASLQSCELTSFFFSPQPLRRSLRRHEVLITLLLYSMPFVKKHLKNTRD